MVLISRLLLNYVAPLAGAWIETSIVFLVPEYNPVAPLAGAWIETNTSNNPIKINTMSHPLRVRGLKHGH